MADATKPPAGTTGAADLALIALDFSQTPAGHTFEAQEPLEALPGKIIQLSSPALPQVDNLAIPVQSYRAVNGTLWDTELEARIASLWDILLEHATKETYDEFCGLYGKLRDLPYVKQVMGDLLCNSAELAMVNSLKKEANK